MLLVMFWALVTLQTLVGLLILFASVRRIKRYGWGGNGMIVTELAFGGSLICLASVFVEVAFLQMITR